MNCNVRHKTNPLWITIGHVGSAKGLRGRFLLQPSKGFPLEVLPKTFMCMLGATPEFGIPAQATVIPPSTLDLNILTSPDDVSSFRHESIHCCKSTLVNTPIDQPLPCELPDAVTRTMSGDYFGTIQELEDYGAGPIVTIINDGATISLPLNAEYFDLSMFYSDNYIQLAKPNEVLEDLWETQS